MCVWGNAEGVVELLLSRVSNLTITKGVLKAAAGNSRGVKVMEMLLAKTSSRLITQEVITLAETSWFINSPQKNAVIWQMKNLMSS